MKWITFYGNEKLIANQLSSTEVTLVLFDKTRSIKTGVVAERIKRLNSVCSSQFKYSEKANAWFAPLGDHSVETLLNAFEGLAKIIDCEPKDIFFGKPFTINGINLLSEKENARTNIDRSNATSEIITDNGAVETGASIAKPKSSTVITQGELFTDNAGRMDGGVRRGAGEERRENNNGESTPPILGESNQNTASIPGDTYVDSGSNNSARRDSIGNYLPAQRGEDISRTTTERFNDNLESIRELGKPNPDKDKINGYTGFGGLLTTIYKNDNRKKLLDLMSSAEYNSVEAAGLYSYFTPNKIVKSIWDLLVSKGYKGGTVLEPAVGTGRFISQRPESLDNNQYFVGIDIDPISAKISKSLFPKSNIISSKFELAIQHQLKGRKFDLVISNLPFGEQSIFDGANNRRLSIHNYFLLKAIQATRPGGIVSVITSTYTLDSQNENFRKELAENGKLLSAIRMPNGIFEDTEVNSDILIFKRYERNEEPDLNQPFIKLETIEFPARRDFEYLLDDENVKVNKGDNIEIQMNSVFFTQNNHYKVCGEISVDRKGISPKPVAFVEGSVSNVLEVVDGVKNEHSAWFNENNVEGVEIEQSNRYYSSRMPVVGSYEWHNEQPIVIRHFQQHEVDSYEVYFEPLSVFKSQLPTIRDYISMRDVVINLLSAERENYDEDKINDLRVILNTKYDAFVDQYGYLTKKENRRLYRNDSLIGYMLGLENFDEETDTATKSDIFRTKVFNDKIIKTSADTLAEASLLAIAMEGTITEQNIERIMGKPLREAMIHEPGIVFKNPFSNEYEHRIKYLIGNVKEKYAIASSAGEEFGENCKYLEAAFPKPIGINDIGLSLGSKWIPDKIVEKFVEAIYLEGGSEVIVKMKKANKFRGGSISIEPKRTGNISAFIDCNIVRFGTGKADAQRVIEAAINSTTIHITYKDEDGKTHTDFEANNEAQIKLEGIKEMFTNWCRRTPGISSELEEIYNTEVNVINYDFDYEPGTYTFQGMSPNWVPRSHQEKFVVSAILNGNMLNCDCVGAGKTTMEIMLAMELSRLGIANKPALIVPNHMLYQVASEAMQIYPNGRICVITKDDLVKENRSAFIGKVSMNNWDVVIFTYSLFREITAPEEYLLNHMDRELDDLRAALSSLDSDDRLSSRAIVARIKKLSEEQENLVSRIQEGANPITLDMLGIQGILYDEVHYLKNLQINQTKTIEGVSFSASQIAYNEYVKMEYLRHEVHGKEIGLYGFTATLVSNSIAEFYNFTRMFRPDLLRNEGIESFNDWVAQYGEIVTALEVLPEGGGFQTKSRLSTFKNLPELLASLRSFTQIHSREELKLPSPPYTEHTLVSEPTKWQRYFFKTTIERARDIRTGVTKDEDNFLAIVGDATRSAISIKTVIPNAPREKDGKLSVVAKNISEIYKKTESLKGVQLVFCDTSTPGKKGYDAYNDIKTFLIEEYSIPEKQIAFIHDYKTDVSKQTLFRKLRAGAIRICFGSTMKMGTGTNVQTRIVALHDIDIPWTPKDLEQRLGRGVRQGNLMDHVDIYRYTTKGSFDVFRLETVKRKAKAFAKAMAHPRFAERTFSEDTAIDYDTIIAESTNNPIIREKAQVESKLLKLVRKQDQQWSEFQRRSSHYREAEKTLPEMEEKKLRFEMAVNRLLNELKTVEDIQAGSTMSDFDRAFYRMVKYKLVIFGDLPGIQGGDTTYLNFNQANDVLTNLANAPQGRAVLGSILGETFCVERGQVQQSLRFISFIDETGAYVSKSIDPEKMLLNQIIRLINEELPERLQRFRSSVEKFQGTLQLGAPIEPANNYHEIEELKTELKRIETEISKIKAPEEEKVTPIPLVMEAYQAAKDKDAFDPNSISLSDLESDTDLNLEGLIQLSDQPANSLGTGA